MNREKFPDKLFYKIGEVCKITDTQPYVLRFWESEFPQLTPQKNRAGQRVYRKSDIELIFKIKQLLYDEEYTIAGARKKLGMDDIEVPEEEPMKQEELTFEKQLCRKETSGKKVSGEGRTKLKRLEEQLESLLDLLDENDRKIKEIKTKLKRQVISE
ncbi:MAG: MerR family transcriptional regulator [Acidobacteriota bacterium]